MGVQAMKHAAKQQEWSPRIAACRSSGMTVRAWCAEQGIGVKAYYYWEKRVVLEANQKLCIPGPVKAAILRRVNPETLPNGETADVFGGITIRHGESVITLPCESSVEAVADLVKALNRYA